MMAGFGVLQQTLRSARTTMQLLPSSHLVSSAASRHVCQSIIRRSFTPMAVCQSSTTTAAARVALAVGSTHTSKQHSSIPLVSAAVFGALLGVTSVVACEAPAASSAETSVTSQKGDPITGIVIPETLEVNGKTLKLVGAGTRTVTFMNFAVYTAGIFFDEAAVKKAVVGQSDAILTAASNDRILTASVPRALRVVSFRKVTGAHLRDGMIRGMVKRIRPSDDRAQAEKEIARFRQEFVKTQLEFGDTCEFHVVGTTLKMFYQGAEIAEFDCPFVCRALFELYMDGTPVSTNIHASLQSRLAQILQ